MHSEAKQTETSEFGTEKFYCRVKQGEWEVCAHKHKLPNAFGEKCIQAKFGVKYAECVFFFLIGWW